MLWQVWSRAGMLRSTLATHSSPVYSLAWAPDSQAVLFSTGPTLTIKPLAPNSKPIQVNILLVKKLEKTNKLAKVTRNC